MEFDLGIRFKLEPNQEQNPKQVLSLRCDDESKECSRFCLKASEQYVREHLKEIMSFQWNKKLNRVPYRSILDMVLCETFVYFQPECLHFYKTKEGNLKGSYSEQVLQTIDSCLYKILTDMVISYNWSHDFN